MAKYIIQGFVVVTDKDFRTLEWKSKVACKTFKSRDENELLQSIERYILNNKLESPYTNEELIKIQEDMNKPKPVGEYARTYERIRQLVERKNEIDKLVEELSMEKYDIDIAIGECEGYLAELREIDGEE